MVRARVAITTPFTLRETKAYPPRESDENHLNDSELGNSGHLEARLGGLDLRSGLGLGVLGRVSNRHFIIS